MDENSTELKKDKTVYKAERVSKIEKPKHLFFDFIKKLKTKLTFKLFLLLILLIILFVLFLPLIILLFIFWLILKWKIKKDIKKTKEFIINEEKLFEEELKSHI